MGNFSERQWGFSVSAIKDAAMALERRFLAVTSAIFIVSVAGVLLFYLA